MLITEVISTEVTPNYGATNGSSKPGSEKFPYGGFSCGQTGFSWAPLNGVEVCSILYGAAKQKLTCSNSLRGFCEPNTEISDFEVESTALNDFALNVAVIEINLSIQIFSGVNSLNIRFISQKIQNDGVFGTGKFTWHTCLTIPNLPNTLISSTYST